jgi:hypothetical protein
MALAHALPLSRGTRSHDITEREWCAGAHHGAVRCGGWLASCATNDHMLVAVVAQNDIDSSRLTQQSAREECERCSACSARGPKLFRSVNRSALNPLLVKDQDSMTAGNGIPPGESGPALQLGQLRI